jgi:hypothetical protein
MSLAVARVATAARGSYKQGPEAVCYTEYIVVESYIAAQETCVLGCAEALYGAVKDVSIVGTGGYQVVAGGQGYQYYIEEGRSFHGIKYVKV